MNRQLPSSNGSSPNSISEEQVREFADKPLRMIPRDWRADTWAFWAYWAGIVQNQIAIAMRLRIWIDDGLTLEDARSIFAALTTTERSCEIKFPGDLFAAMAAMASRRIIDRKRDQKIRDERARVAHGPNPEADAIKKTLAEVFKVTE